MTKSRSAEGTQLNVSVRPLLEADLPTADHVMRLAGVRRRRRQQASDRLAATLLLQSWLDARRGPA